MSKKEMAPWRWGRLRHTDIKPVEDFQHEMASLQRDMDNLISDFWNGRESMPALRRLAGEGMLSPEVDETEDDKGFHIKVDLPGMDEKDVEVTLVDGILTIKGEKKQEEEEKGKDFYRRERSFGSFRWTLPVPADVNESKIQASFKKGVLCIDLPKTEEAKKKVKKIAIKAS